MEEGFMILMMALRMYQERETSGRSQLTEGIRLLVGLCTVYSSYLQGR